MGHDKELRHDDEIRQLKEDVRVLAARVNVLTASPRDAEKALDNGGSAGLVESGSSADAERTDEAKRQLSSKATRAAPFRHGWSCCGRPYTGPHANHCSNRDVAGPCHADRPADEKSPPVEERQGSAVGSSYVAESSTEKQNEALLLEVFDLKTNDMRLRACLRDVREELLAYLCDFGVPLNIVNGITDNIDRALSNDGPVRLDANPEPPAAPIDHAAALGELSGFPLYGGFEFRDSGGRVRFRGPAWGHGDDRRDAFRNGPFRPVPLTPENADASDKEAEERDDDKVPHGPV